MEARNVLLVVFLVGLATASLVQAKSSDDQGTAVDCPRRCCRKFDWSMIADPTGFEEKTGCRVECCEKIARKQGSRALAKDRQNIFSNLISCITELLINITNFSFKIPPVCCQIPPMSLLPVCSSSNGKSTRIFKCKPGSRLCRRTRRPRRPTKAPEPIDPIDPNDPQDPPGPSAPPKPPKPDGRSGDRINCKNPGDICPPYRTRRPKIEAPDGSSGDRINCKNPGDICPPYGTKAPKTREPDDTAGNRINCKNPGDICPPYGSKAPKTREPDDTAGNRINCKNPGDICPPYGTKAPKTTPAPEPEEPTEPDED